MSDIRARVKDIICKKVCPTVFICERDDRCGEVDAIVKMVGKVAEHAHMAGQMNAGCKHPSPYNALCDYKKIVKSYLEDDSK